MKQKLKSFRFIAAIVALAAAIVAIPSIVGAIGPSGNGPVVLESGTYTPTLVSAGSQNVSSATFAPAVWSRVGDTVTLSGFVNVNATNAAFTQIAYTLPSDAPYAPSTAADKDVVGSISSYEGTTSYPLAAGVGVETTQKVPRVWFQAQQAGSVNAHWSVQYQVR